MSNFPSVRPSLNLQFDSQPTPADMTSHLASVGATFSRASVGTYTDANGIIQEATAGQARPNYSSAGVHEGLLIEESRTNLIEASEDLTDSNWGKETDVYVLENQAIAPDGKASADKLVYPSTNQFHRLSYALSVTNGTTYSFSAYVKADGYDFILIRWQGFVSGGQDNVSFDLVDVEVDYVNSNFDSASIEAVGNDWYKITVVGTAYTDSSSVFRIRFQPTANTDNGISTFIGDDESGGFVWGAQFEEGSFPTSYIPTIPTFSSRASTATFFDSNGVLQTQASQSGESAEGRIDHKYIDGQWVEAGLLLEGESVNYAKASEDLDNTTYWLPSRTTVTADTETDPKGGTNSYLLSETTDTGNHWLGGQSSHAQAVAIGETWTMSVFVKKGDGANAPDIMQLGWGSGGFGSNGYANFNITTNVVTDIGSGLDSAKIEDFEDWKRISITATATANDSNAARLFLYFTNNDPDAIQGANYAGQTDANVFVWGAQVEQQSQPTSYIPTTTATATRSADVYTTETKDRSADVCYIDGTAFTDFYNDSEGTVLCDFIYPTVDFGYVWNINDGGSSDRFEAQIRNSNQLYVYVVTSLGSDINTSETGFTDGQATKLIANYTSSQIRTTKDGGTVNTASTSIPVLLFNTLNIGSRYDDTIQKQIKIGKLIYFPRALSDNELIKLTQ